MGILLDHKLTDHIRLRYSSGTSSAISLEVTGEDPNRPTQSKTYHVTIEEARFVMDLVEKGAAVPLPLTKP